MSRESTTGSNDPLGATGFDSSCGLAVIQMKATSETEYDAIRADIARRAPYANGETHAFGGAE